MEMIIVAPYSNFETHISFWTVEVLLKVQKLLAPQNVAFDERDYHEYHILSWYLWCFDPGVWRKYLQRHFLRFVSTKLKASSARHIWFNNFAF